MHSCIAHNTPHPWPREIREFQRSTKLLVPRAPFQRLVRELLANAPQGGMDKRLSVKAALALQVRLAAAACDQILCNAEHVAAG